MILNSDVLTKYNNLKSLLSDMGQVLVAYSGGIDSTLLLKIGTDLLGTDCLGVIAISPSISKREHQEALETSKSIGAHLLEIETEELDNALYQKNDDKRCFYCKTELFEKLKILASEKAIPFILDGNNLDDTSDYRPGRQAAKDLGIRSPLIETGFTKDDIRNLARYLNLSNWNKPAQPCLSSRIAYGIPVNEEVLNKIEQAESCLKEYGFQIVRVRYLGDKVSIEVGAEEVHKLHDEKLKQKIFSAFGQIGLTKIDIDWDGYSSGKLNVIRNQAL